MHISEINCSIRWVVTGDLSGLALHYWICQVYDILITAAVTDSEMWVSGVGVSGDWVVYLLSIVSCALILEETVLIQSLFM